MAAVDELNLTSAELPDADFKEVVASLFWGWFDSHLDQKVTTVSVWFIHKTVYVRDLESIFVMLFGHR